MRARPTVEIAIGLRVPEQIGLESQQNTVDQQAAIFVAGEAIAATTRPDFGDVLGEQFIQQALGIWSLELQRKLPGIKDCRFLAQQPVAVFG
jgi:hypothetical protein